MAHTITLYGPGLLALVAASLLIWVGSAAVVIDALRRYTTDFASGWDRRWFYVIPQLVFFISYFAWQIPWVQEQVPLIGWLVLTLPLILAQQMAYLLRLVFPTAKRLEKRRAADEAAGIVRVTRADRRAAKRAAREAAGEDGMTANEHGDAEPQSDDYFDIDDDGSAPDA